MENLKLCDSEYRFMLIVWENAPIGSGSLVELCKEKLGWKKSTTYTTIKKLSEKGYIKNENAIVTILIPKEEVQAIETDYFVERTFEGSLPQFVAAFLGGKRISHKEAQEIKRLIDLHKEE
ncbi:putative transcriptional regulator [Mobilisporobacter senegalensis]|uniref:Putative transcriptional regulator n=1 Tax=Mobilisporobacter senegalensis TaxID=1329262 RepID=A0A3N1XR75_9FIRM|nr:BlaI/MecI/CopY family transcriptional regulator [Mobilisporobacter senegalensis]ROR29169.1 putative transcriptional regulator [Mobilisporobacter senegalensis]